MHVIKKAKGELSSLPAKELDFEQLKPLHSNLARKVLEELNKKPSYPKDIARKLKENEQKIYYHIKNLEKAGIIEVTKRTTVHGAAANIYKLTEPAFVLSFKQFETAQKIAELEEAPKSFLEPFIENGKLNCQIIVGSPDPHGPEKARSRDGFYGIDFALFLGTFLNYIPDLNVKLDTEARTEDLQENLILIGGPVVNIVTGKINQKLPIFFDKSNNWNIVSALSNKTYYSDESAIIAKIKNPFNKKKHILVIAGKRYSGTKAVIIAFIKYFNEIIKGNKHDSKIIAKVVEGVDLNSDGIVDDVEILE